MDDDATSSIPVPKSKPKVNKSKSKGKAKSKEPMPVTREEEEDVSDDESKTKTKAKKSDSFPVHTHPVDTEDVHSDCELCNDVGNSMMDDDDTKDFEITDDVKTRLKNILASIDENSGSDTEEDAE